MASKLIFPLLFLSLFMCLFVHQARGAMDMGHGGHGHGSPSMPKRIELNQQFAKTCKYVASDGSRYDLSALERRGDMDDWHIPFRPYGRDLLLGVCRKNTNIKCGRENIGVMEGNGVAGTHAVCLPTDKGDLVIGRVTGNKLNATDSDKGPKMGTTLHFGSGDACPTHPKRTMQTIVNIYCDMEGDDDDDDLMVCPSADFRSSDPCVVEATCFSRCACPNMKHACVKGMDRSWGDWNDWGHLWIAILLNTGGLLFIYNSFFEPEEIERRRRFRVRGGILSGTVVGGSGGSAQGSIFLALLHEQNLIEAILLIMGGIVFGSLTMFCCEFWHPPGLMHLLVGVILCVFGIWKLLFEYEALLKNKVYQFTSPFLLIFVGYILFSHGQNNGYLATLHVVLGCAMVATGLLVGLSIAFPRLRMIAGISAMLSGWLLVSSSHGVSRIMQRRNLMAMDAVFAMTVCSFTFALIFVLLLLKYCRPQFTPSGNKDGSSSKGSFTRLSPPVSSDVNEI
eukprot:TRINITY_DN4431_c8_g1_i1.p1 TRINITY_DN4431_c8_g1~~TRINITY_DN4431_c8_g1_i1.p1  ORF type:complete len:508 (+),score=92.56 TRINITY_DN4431_c8_g1_i1:132-1655(+)